MPSALVPADWLDLGSFDDEHIGVLKTGKDSEVHLVARVGTRRTALLAEKRFRSRERRWFKDDYMYRGVWGEGTRREHRAMRKNTRFGQEAIHARWMAHEWDTLVKLSAAGVTVPPPVDPTDGGYLMAFIGDGVQAAPRLSEVRLDRVEAARVWTDLTAEVARMLEAEVVHGDLSAFNVLWWRRRAVIIDLSQAVDAVTHPAARDLLARDVERLAHYFERAGVSVDVGATLARIGDSPARFARQMS